jgi:hypothetical protein
MRFLALLGMTTSGQIAMHLTGARELGADQAVEADALFSGFDREGAMDFGWNSDDEFSAVGFSGEGSGRRLLAVLHILDGFLYDPTNSL